MADWRQIQARIRKAKAGTDVAAKLAELYEHTRDAMVAFELARWQEKAGEHAEAARWYTAAAERFRRSQWKSKAQAALARLRPPAAAGSEPQEPLSAVSSTTDETPRSEALGAEFPSGPDSSDEPEVKSEPESVANFEERSEVSNEMHSAGASRATQDEAVPKGPRRRGRRGGRNRRRLPKRATSGAATVPSRAQTEDSQVEASPERVASLPAQHVSEFNAPSDAAVSVVPSPIAVRRVPSRAGEPALASRMAHLESQLRRLLACPHVKLDQAESAPAGPGVLLLSDSDQVTHYYVESCQTLRIAIGNLVRGGRGGKDLPRLKERLAENLGIAESRVTSYLKEHCSVRWLQLDEGASELAHFAIAVLRPVVNE